MAVIKWAKMYKFAYRKKDVITAVKVIEIMDKNNVLECQGNVLLEYTFH